MLLNGRWVDVGSWPGLWASGPGLQTVRQAGLLESCASLLTRGWLSPQRAVPQDTGFSSLFLKVLMQILQWLDSPAVEDGPLQAQLKLFATRYSARRRISDGERDEGSRWARTVAIDVSGPSVQRGMWAS